MNTELDKTDVWRQAHARLQEENLALQQQLAAEREKHTIEVQKLYAEIHNLSEVKQRLMVQLAAARAK